MKGSSQSTISRNISEMSKTHPHEQAVAAALNMARHSSQGGKVHSGPINVEVPGRTDRLPVHVHDGSYVIPADVVSSLGEGNTLAGNKILDHLFSNGHYAEAVKRAHGGRTHHKEVPVVVAGGEYILTPEQVMAVGGGDLDKGHKILDEFVKTHRKITIKTLKKLPGPAKD